jgi:5-(carboxyamino)imidazole ribonucleotide mutase
MRMTEPAEAADATVGVIMGSDSDFPVMAAAVEVLAEFGVPCEVRVVSAHRTPEAMLGYAKAAAGRGLKVIIAGAGGAAHLPGMVAALTPLPVIGVPVPLKHLDGMDSLLSIVQMPAGVPVATVSIGGARNAGLLAVRILASQDAKLRERMELFQQQLAETAHSKDRALADRVRTLGR